MLGPRGVVLADGLTAGEWWDRLNACEGTARAVDSRGMVLATHGPAALQMQAQARRSNDELCARLGECEWTVSYRKAVA